MSIKRDPPHASVGFLMHEVSRLLRREISRRVQRLGLTTAQWVALARLSFHEGINQAALADILEVQPITLGRTLDRLAEAGLVERRPDPGDRRAFQLYLTPAARPLMEKLYEAAAQVREQALAGMPAETRAMVIDVLTGMRNNLMRNAASPIPASMPAKGNPAPMAKAEPAKAGTAKLAAARSGGH
jgi:MarR family transcriptional regulator for hemolysin